jgi:Cullin family
MHNPRTTEHRGSKRGTAEKRRHVQQESNGLQQRSISDLLSSNKAQARDCQQPSSPKRLRSSITPSPSPNKTRDTLISSDKMYNFSSSDPKTSEKFSRKINGPAVVTRPSNFTPHTGAKRLVVKNLRSGPRLNPDEYFEKIWSQLSATLDLVFDGGKPTTSLEELYKGAENVCRQGRAAMLAKKLQERCKTYVINNLRQNLAARSNQGTNIDTLRAAVDAWTAWNTKLVSNRATVKSDFELFPNSLNAGHDSMDILLPRPVVPVTLERLPRHQRDGVDSVPNIHFP